MNNISKYRPSNGVEGLQFLDKFCHQCVNNIQIDEHGFEADCGILTRALIFGVHDVEYPIEWQHGPTGEPTCLAFEHDDSLEVPVPV